MAGLGGHVLSHVVRRGLDQYRAMDDDVSFVHDVPVDVPAYNDQPPQHFKFDIPDGALIATGIVLALTVLIVLSIDYTVGGLMASLAMVESPSTTTIVESKPPAYSDEPDAPLEKQGLIDEEAEIVVIKHKPVTAHTRTTIRHLHRVGGWTARWRGLGQYMLYHFSTNALAHFITRLFGRHNAPVSQILGFIIATLLTCRLHMLWTHAAIGMPTATRWYKRFVPRKQCRAVLLPTLVYAVAQQITIAVPLATTYLVGISFWLKPGSNSVEDMSGFEIAFAIFKVLTIPASAVICALFVLLPAATTLTRVEACLVPEEQGTIVPFDKMAIMGDIDLSVRGAPGQLFKAAWKSFNGATRWRLVKVYLKLFLYQFVVSFMGGSIAAAIMYFSMRDQFRAVLQTYVV